MNRNLELKLLDELVELKEGKQPYLDEAWVKPTTGKYFDEDHFEAERKHVFRRQPVIALHASELGEAGAYRTLEMAGRPLLIVRGEDGAVRAFYNVCRHRGAQLVGGGQGCSKRFSCPYHAWTWNNQGDLVGVPHEKTGFPDLRREEFGLTQVACAEYAGFIWVCQHGSAPRGLNIAEHLGPIATELKLLGAEGMRIFASDSWEFNANWKLIIEGGLEAYHFRVAHRDTIAPLFLDNLSSYQCFGNHIRSVLPRSHLGELSGKSRQDWDIRAYTNLLYTLFPSTQFLVQEDHIAWIQVEPLAAGKTRLRLSTLAPAADQVPARENYWRSNHNLTVRTLGEDFAIGEGIQKGFCSGANSHLNYGRFEGALARFNEAVSNHLPA